MKRIASVIFASLLSSAAFAGPQLVVKGSEDVLGNKIGYPDGQAEITGLKIIQKPGECNGWHSHPVPTFGLVSKGTLTVAYATGDKKVFKAGDALIEAQHVAHEGCNTGEDNVEIIVFYAGAEGVPNTIKKEDERPD